MRHADLAPDTPIDLILGLLQQPPGPWPGGWTRWPNVMQAHLRWAEFTIRNLPADPPASWCGRGVVIVGGGKYWASTYVTVRVLRHVGCTLPIEVWYLGCKGEIDPWRESLLARHNVTCVDADRVRKRHPMRIMNGWELKPFALLHSRFREVLYLDADCYPNRNPEFLFDERDYRQCGAIFWQDPPSMRLKPSAWTAFGVPYRNEPAFESGQIVLDKARCWRPLALAVHYNAHSDFYYQTGCYGDKDLFHMAWRKLGYEYAQPPHRPGGGGWGLYQNDFAGNGLFIHRIHDKWRLRGTSLHTSNQIAENQCHGLPLDDYCLGVLRHLQRLTNERTGAMSLPDGSLLPAYFGMNRDDFEQACRGAARSAHLGDVTLCRVMGRFQCFVEPGNVDLVPWLLLDGFWESWVTQAMARAVRPGWHCVDGGSGYGYYALLMAAAAGPTGKVLAVEAHPKLAALIRRSAAANGFPIDVRHAALADGPGAELCLARNAERLDGCRGGEHAERFTARTTTIDEVTAGWERCDLVKLDIEGMEWDALRGAEETVRRFPHCAFVAEFFPAAHPDAAGFLAWLQERWPILRYVHADGTPHEADAATLLGEPQGWMLWLQK